MRHLAYYLHHFFGDVIHLIRLRTSTAYADEYALHLDTDTMEFLAECHVNDWAADLRARGYDVPVGTLLAGVRVTR